VPSILPIPYDNPLAGVRLVMLGIAPPHVQNMSLSAETLPSEAKYKSIRSSQCVSDEDEIQVDSMLALEEHEQCICAETSDTNPQLADAKATVDERQTHHHIGILPLAVLIFYNVSGVYAFLESRDLIDLFTTFSFFPDHAAMLFLFGD
jgi:hypothetical protein